MPRRIHENWLKAYVNYTRFSESPDSYHFWTGVATMAGALRRRVWIDQRQFQWTPNFYIILVGPPGVAAKSTSIRSGLSLLEKVEGVYFGPQSMTWQALTEALQNAQEMVDIPGQIEPEVMSCLTIGVSELGTFLRADDGELVDVLVAMWDGQKEVWRRQTRTQGNTVIHNAWLNIIGCTTPAWLKENFPEVFIGGGLTSRILFVYADRKRQLVAYPGDFIPAAEYQQEAENLLHDLKQIAALRGEYELHPSAKRWGIQWYENHWHRPRPDHLKSDRFDGYYARKQTHLHKTAMVIAAAKRNDLVILEEDLQEAELLITSLEGNMMQVFNSMGLSQEGRKNTELVNLVRSSKHGLEYATLWRMCFSSMSGKDFQDSLLAGVKAGYLKMEKRHDANGKEFQWIRYIQPTDPSSDPSGEGPGDPGAEN